jgi:hypothetical protein
LSCVTLYLLYKCIGRPATEIKQLFHATALITPVPDMHVLVQVTLVVQPPALVNVMSERATDHIVLVRVVAVDEKFGETYSPAASDECVFDKSTSGNSKSPESYPADNRTAEY